MDCTDSVDAMYLSTKEAKALRLLGVASIGDLLALDPKRVLELPGYGRWTHDRIVGAQADLRRSLPAVAPTFGSGGTAGDNGVVELATPVADARLDLSAREFRALAALKVATVGQLLSLDPDRVMQVRACGRTTRGRVLKPKLQADFIH